MLGAAQAQVRLLPAPREAHFGKTTDLPAKVVVAVPGHNAEDQFAGRDLEEAFQSVAPAANEPHGVAQSPYRITLLRTGTAAAKTILARANLGFDPVMEPEGYILVIAPHDAAIVATTSAGVFYGVQTFEQLLPMPGAQRVLLTGTVRDWPAMRYRGIDDDLSRGPFPTLEFQKHQIRVFASFKINVYSPYFEHTLLYPDHPLAAPPGGSLTPSEAKDLVAYARQYHVIIVPEQEALGHLHHALKYEIYQDVAETPHGRVLAPGQPVSLSLLKDWLTDIAQEFPSPFIHLGADETFDLGLGRTIAFPALLFTGVPPIPANATNTIALWTAAGGQRRRVPQQAGRAAAGDDTTVRGEPGGRTVRGAAVAEDTGSDLSASPAVAHAGSDAAFCLRQETGWQARIGNRAEIEHPRTGSSNAEFQLVVAVYGGYFGGGMGIARWPCWLRWA